eukprot:4165038-Pyramimonas_sp.AAC.1
MGRESSGALVKCIWTPEISLLSALGLKTIRSLLILRRWYMARKLYESPGGDQGWRFTAGA